VRRFLVLLAALPALLAAAPADAATGGAKADEAVVVINGAVDIPRAQTVDGVFLVHGDARIAGHVDGDAVVVSGDALVSGRVDGNLVMISGTARLLRGARVGGDLRYGDKQPLISRGATVGGTTGKEDWTGSIHLLPFVGAFVLWFAISLSSVVLGILLLLIAPRAADALFDRARERMGPVVAIGIAIFIALPVAAFVAAITFFGLPLAIGIGLALLPLAGVAYVTTAWVIGRAIVKAPRERILAFLAGLAILRAAALIPILGVLIWLAAVVVGLGLIGAAIGAAREPAGAQSPGS
jgi:hypothetical protein